MKFVRQDKGCQQPRYIEVQATPDKDKALRGNNVF